MQKEGLTMSNAYSFYEQADALFEQLGDHHKMVLSTSADGQVTSRMMSILILDRAFYFQTDQTMRKFLQLQKNPNAALCFDNVQIEGTCTLVGRPCDNKGFSIRYQQAYPHSYSLYSGLDNERLLRLTPTFIKRWTYIDGKPFEECFDFAAQTYCLKVYRPE